MNIEKILEKKNKELRELSDISVKDIQQALSIVIEAYTKYETGEADIPARFIYEIENKFLVDLSLLLTGEESRKSIYDDTHSKKGISIEKRKEYKH